MINIDNNIFIVSKDKNIDEEVDKLFKYWREKGLPNYDINNYNKEEELKKIINFDENRIYHNKELGQTMHGCGFLWTYFPHWVDIKCGNATTSLLDNWKDDIKLKSLIKKTYKWQLKHGNGKFTVNRLRQNAKVYCSKQSVSNFRPTVAKYIYNKFGNNGTVWDMSCGWGGRLFGFLASDCKKYIGTEPSSLTYNGLIQLANDFIHINKNIQIYKQGSETFIPEAESLDLCFTSPPYFDTEKYSSEPTQSYIKFPTIDLWLNGFLTKTFKNCYYGLKKDGYLIVNIANTQYYSFLAEKSLEIAKTMGFKHVDTYWLILSSISGKGKKKEPVYILKK